MATITRFPWLRHVRTEPSSWIAHTRDGRVVRQGKGLAFWCLPLSASLVEVPLDDRELPILFHGRSRDYQDVAVQAVVTWRVERPEVLARRIDFTLDLDTGTLRHEPLEQVAQLLTQLAQQLAWTHLAAADVRELLRSGVDAIRTPIADGLTADPIVGDLGISIVSVRIASIRPDTDVERALETPAREDLQQQADEARFARRALAVDKERAIAENELQNQIELAKREELLIAQRGANEQRRVTDDADARRVEATGKAQRRGIHVQAEADAIAQTGRARNAAEAERVAIYQTLGADTLLAMAVRQLAENPPAIEHLSLGGDSLGPAMQRLLSAGTTALER